MLEKLNLRFFYLNLTATLVFACLYYLQDYFIVHNKEFAYRFGLLEKTHIKNDISDKVNPFTYHLWFSLITQTTVGYGGVDSSKTGKSESYLNTPSRVAKLINFVQLLSVLFIVSIV